MDFHGLLIFMLIPLGLLLLTVLSLIPMNRKKTFRGDLRDSRSKFSSADGELDRDALLIAIRDTQEKQEDVLQEIKSNVGCLFAFMVLLIVVWVVRMILVLFGVIT